MLHNYTEPYELRTNHTTGTYPLGKPFGGLRGQRQRSISGVSSVAGAIGRRHRARCSTGAALERMADAPQLDFGAFLEAVSEPAAPVVKHRRRVA